LSGGGNRKVDPDDGVSTSSFGDGGGILRWSFGFGEPSYSGVGSGGILRATEQHGRWCKGGASAATSEERWWRDLMLPRGHRGGVFIGDELGLVHTDSWPILSRV
jgi:hypothetical protein